MLSTSTLIKKNSAVISVHGDIFGIHGGGNIGLGLMADIVSKSSLNYHIIATSNDQFIANIINNTHQYSLRHSKETKLSSNTLVKNVKIISRDSSSIVELYKKSKIIAICLTPAVVISVAIDIAKGLLARYENGNANLNILILMNTPKCDLFVKEKIKMELKNLVNNDEVIDKILSNTKFIPTVVDRIVTKIAEKDVISHLIRQLTQSSSYDQMDLEYIDSQLEILLSNPVKLYEVIKEFKLEIPLFNAEESYALYVPKEYKDAKYFPSIKRVNNIDQIETIKNKYINGPHAIIGWIGALFGCKTIAEAIRIPGVRKFIKQMMDEEIRPALIAEFPDITSVELDHLRKIFIKRCLASIDDPVVRVGRDPMRKINANGRIRGTIELYNKHRLKGTTSRLEHGLAAAILYAVKGIDNANPGCIKCMEIYNKNHRDYKAVLCYQGASPAGMFKGLDPIKDKRLVENILMRIKYLETLYNDRLMNGNLDTDLFFSENRMILYDKPVSNFIGIRELHESNSQGLVFYAKSLFQVKNIKMHFDIKSMVSSKFILKYENKMNISKKLFEIGISTDEKGHIRYAKHFKSLELRFDLVFVRHGETYGNCGQATSDGKIDKSYVMANNKAYDRRIFQGNVDTEINMLTDYGKQQALSVAKQLEEQLLKNGWSPDIIFYSPLSRARDTGLPFVERNGLIDRFVQLNDLREMCFGSWENRRVCDMKVDDPCHLFYKNQNALVKHCGINVDGEFQNSENFCEVLIRAYNLLQALNENCNDKRIIMFSHSMFGAACFILLGMGQVCENNNYLAFDGKRGDGKSYAISNATPYYLNMGNGLNSSIKIKA